MSKKMAIGFAVVIFCIVSMTSFSIGSDLITSYMFWGKSGTQSFVIHPGISEVIFEPWVTGCWWFKPWHFFSFAPKSYIAVFTYWRDVSNPNDQWHYWPGGGLVGYYYFLPAYRTLLYNGKSSIAYKFLFRNDNDFAASVKINLEKI